VKISVKKVTDRDIAHIFCEKPPKKKKRIIRAAPGNTFSDNQI